MQEVEKDMKIAKVGEEKDKENAEFCSVCASSKRPVHRSSKRHRKYAEPQRRSFLIEGHCIVNAAERKIAELHFTLEVRRITMTVIGYRRKMHSEAAERRIVEALSHIGNTPNHNDGHSLPKRSA